MALLINNQYYVINAFQQYLYCLNDEQYTRYKHDDKYLNTLKPISIYYIDGSDDEVQLNAWLLKCLDSVPEITLCNTPLNDSNPNVTALALEGEWVYCDNQSPSSIQYLGTQNVGSCIAVYINDGTQQCLVHVNDDEEFIGEMLGTFHKNVNDVTLIGGRMDCLDRSKDNIIHVLRSLLDSRHLFRIKSHKLLSRNVITKRGIFEKYKNIIIDCAKAAHRRLFDEEMPRESYEAMLNNNDRGEEFPESAICSAADFFDTCERLPTFEKYVRFVNREEFREGITREQLNNLTKMMLSKKGLTYLVRNEYWCVANNTDLPDFVINIHTHVVQPISGHMQTEFDINRRLSLYDLEKEPGYFLAYDGVGYREPSLSHNYKNTLVLLNTSIQSGLYNESIVQTIKSNTNTSDHHIETLAGLILRLFPTVREPQAVLRSPLMFRSSSMNNFFEHLTFSDGSLSSDDQDVSSSGSPRSAVNSLN